MKDRCQRNEEEEADKEMEGHRREIQTGQLSLDVVQVCRAGVADGDGGRCHALTAIHIQEIS